MVAIADETPIGAMIKKHKVAVFVDAGTATVPEWVRLKKSTELNISMEAEEETYEYASDENPTTEIKTYAPSIAQSLVLYKGEPDFEFVWNKFYQISTAKVKTMVVFMFDGNKTDGYKAWLTESTMMLNEFNAYDSSITFDIKLGGNVEKGLATMAGDKPTFKQPTTPPVV